MYTLPVQEKPAENQNLYQKKKKSKKKWKILKRFYKNLVWMPLKLKPQ